MRTPLIVFFTFLASIWIIEIVDTILLGSGLQQYGLIPRKIDHFYGILTMPFLHGDWDHISHNTYPLLVFGLSLILLLDKAATKVFIQLVLLTGCLVWLFGQTGIHVGASGLIFSLFGFLVFWCLTHNHYFYMIIGCGIMYFNAHMISGMNPFQVQSDVSWTGHLLGFIAGIILAINNKDKV